MSCPLLLLYGVLLDSFPGLPWSVGSAHIAPARGRPVLCGLRLCCLQSLRLRRDGTVPLVFEHRYPVDTIAVPPHEQPSTRMHAVLLGALYAATLFWAPRRSLATGMGLPTTRVKAAKRKSTRRSSRTSRAATGRRSRRYSWSASTESSIAATTTAPAALARLQAGPTRKGAEAAFSACRSRATWMQSGQAPHAYRT